MLAIVDDFTRECLALIADTSLPGLRVIKTLVARRGRPAMCVSDNGTELTGTAVPLLVPGDADRVALHRTWQAGPECLHRKLQRSASRPTAQGNTAPPPLLYGAPMGSNVTGTLSIIG